MEEDKQDTPTPAYDNLKKDIKAICRKCTKHVWWATQGKPMCHLYLGIKEIPPEPEDIMEMCPLVPEILNRIEKGESYVW